VQEENILLEHLPRVESPGVPRYFELKEQESGLDLVPFDV
jgi:hypothetical protein